MKLVLIVWILSALQQVAHSKKEKFILDSRGRYQNLLVHISHAVPENDGKLLTSIKNQLSLASKSLFVATNELGQENMAVQFANIYISVPSNWNLDATPMTWQESKLAHVQVVSKRENKNSNKPFTKQSNKCGKSGKFIRFPDGFFESSSNEETSQKGKEIMREFVKFRFGVFSEEPFKNILFVHDGTHLVNGSCGQNIQWEVNDSASKCSDKNSHCKYKISRNQSHNYSVMFDTKTASSQFFCNDRDRPHNKFAYNLQNINCHGQSITAVIMKHADFGTVASAKRLYKDPVFHIVKQRGRKIVFVLDNSGSMTEEIVPIKTAVQMFIEQSVEPAAEVGIVTFNGKATRISSLLKMSSEKNRKDLSTKLNNIECFGFTNISNGLEEGVKVLQGRPKEKNKRSESIVLLTDGETFGDKPSNFQQVYKHILRRDVVVHIISVGNKIDPKLSKLSRKSGGLILFTTENNKLLDLLKKIFGNGKYYTNTNHRKSTQASENQLKILSSKRKYKFTYKYKVAGENTIVTVLFKRDISKYEVQMSDPDGDLIDADTINSLEKQTEVVFKIPGSIKTGTYMLEFTRKRSRNKDVAIEKKSAEFSVSYVSLPLGSRVINPIGELSKTSIELLDETSYVTATIDMSTCRITKFEKVSIYLEIQSPQKKITLKKLTDDGMGDDSIYQDKVFTRNIFAKDLSVPGFYNFVGHVEIINLLTSGKIKRTVSFESLIVKKVKDSVLVDKIPPAQMQEPIVKVLDSKKKIIELKVIATGDDSMDGKITKYQILIRSKIDEIIAITRTLEPYEETDIMVDIGSTKVETIFGIAIRGVDESNNVGEWSPMIFINLKN